VVEVEALFDAIPHVPFQLSQLLVPEAVSVEELSALLKLSKNAFIFVIIATMPGIMSSGYQLPPMYLLPS